MQRFLLLVLVTVTLGVVVDLSNKTEAMDLSLIPVDSVAKEVPSFVILPFSGEPAMTACKMYDACNSDATTADGGWPVDSAYHIVYQDGLKVVLCLCQTPGMDPQTFASTFAYVPLPIRSTVLKLTSKVGGNGAAYAIGQSLTFMGRWPANTMTHEAGHAFDYANGISDSTAWTDALIADPCVANWYAKSNQVEAWAEVCIAWTYYARLGINETDVANNEVFSCWLNQRKVAKAILPFNETREFNASEPVTITAKFNSSLVMGYNPGWNIVAEPAQTLKWHVVQTYGSFFLLCDSVSMMCMDSYNGQFPGPVWYGYGRNAQINQQWTILPDGEGYHKIISRYSGKVLEHAACSRNTNTIAIIWADDSNSECQKWRLTGGSLGKPPSTSTTTELSTTSEASTTSEISTTFEISSTSSSDEVSTTSEHSTSIEETTETTILSTTSVQDLRSMSATSTVAYCLILSTTAIIFTF